MQKDFDLSEELGHHCRRSRVIWHPGSIPPYSSLWITIQRFLMLNQPTRRAFAHDFIRANAVSKQGLPVRTHPRLSLNDYQLAQDQSPVRVTRFARVLKEASTVFRGCHIGEFTKSVRPYFGDFAVCYFCLAEGFHSVLYSFDGLKRCPVHGTKMESLNSNRTVAIDLFSNALRNPFGQCQYLRTILKSPEVRTPTRHAERDRVLGEIVDWLMDIESRVWLGQHGSQQVNSLSVFTSRLACLKTNLEIANAVPDWACSDASVQRGVLHTDLIRFGAMKVRKGDLVHIDDRRAVRHQMNLGIYGKTTFGDFKAIRRHLTRRSLGSRGRHWLAPLAKATSGTDVKALLARGGDAARRAWLFLVWSRHINERDFNPKAGLHTRPMRFAVDWEIPLWIADIEGARSAHGGHDVVRLWIARWISAAGLFGFWHFIYNAAKHADSNDIHGLKEAVSRVHQEPRWGLGISVNGELVLCLDRPSVERSDPQSINAKAAVEFFGDE